jgi:hypothetical protein
MTVGFVTCEEFKRLCHYVLEPDLPSVNVTCPQRTLMREHYRSCSDCRKWLDDKISWLEHIHVNVVTKA